MKRHLNYLVNICRFHKTFVYWRLRNRGNISNEIQPDIFVYGFAKKLNNELYFIGNKTALTSEQIKLYFPVESVNDQI